MDASDEFVVVSGRNYNGHHKKLGTRASSVENLRNVPVCIYNTNKNFKLQFLWNRAFKLFESQRTVYKAASGINYQNCSSHSGTSRSTGISLRAKSLSHSHLSGLGSVMEQPETSQGSGTNRSLGQEKSNGNKNEIAYEGEQNVVPVAMPRKRTVYRIGGGRNSNATNVKARPVSLISGGEKPQGRMGDNCIQMGNNIGIPVVPVHLRRTQSTRSRYSVDSLLTCHNNDDNDNYKPSALSRKSHSPAVHNKLVKSQTGLGGAVRFSPSTDLGLCERGNCSDCSSEIVSNLDSGLDTWRDTRSPTPGMKPKLRDSSGIVCTISQRIPAECDDNSDGALLPSPRREPPSSPINSKYDDSLESCSKMNRKHDGDGNTTVVLINGCFELDQCQNSVQFDSLNLSEYECMSEIDLNSGSSSGSGFGDSVKPNRDEVVVDNKEKFVKGPNNNNNPPCENELDSLDLTLFEAARKADPFYRVSREEMSDHQNDEPLYDTVCSEDNSETVRTGDTNSSNSSSVYINSWTDAGSEFEFMTSNTTPNREIHMGHNPRGSPPEVDWEPYFCVLNQLDQMFTAYRSEEMSLTENGASPTEIPRIRLDGGPSSIKCLINNAKWGMNTLLEEEEESAMNGNSSEKGRGGDAASGSIQRNSSPFDTSYDKACSSAERRTSAPLTPILGRETSSRFANFFSKRSFKSNPLKRTKSVTKLERKKPVGTDQDSGLLYPSRLRTSRSHESLLAWTNHSVNSLVNNGMMSTTDLAGGNVTIRPIHPSVLGQDFAFQICTPVGSKYYLCSSAAERDAWVYALRQAIKPHADEIRRQDNSLKLWVLEAKGLVGSGKSSSKKHFCELYLDEVLYARTCGKPKGDMLFWGEHFEFSQLPNCVQMITVVLFREGDKKKKRNTCIGRVKIPVNSVNSRYLIEKWYPIVPDSTSQSGKDKECPSMRVKCKFQSVDILPVRCYKPFLQYIKNEYGPVSECLESVLSVKAKEDLASALVHVLHHESLAKEFIAELALQEILKSGDEKLTFRGNSIATKAMEAFLKLTGTEYLHASLGPFIEHFQRSEDVLDCEVDPMKLSQGADLAKNQQNLRMAIDTVWKAILHSHSMFPAELRECFTHCRESLRTAGKEFLSDHLISASIFLRFLCPAVLSPSLFNITNEYPTEKSARNLTLVAKVLQTLANFTRFQGKESYMEFINDFVEREAHAMKSFLSSISSPSTSEVPKKSKDKIPAGGFIDLGKYSSILSALLTENVAKIAPKNDRFKHLQEILETIHLWLKQPPNVTSIASFPFPHVTSPAPTISPPPAPLGVPINYRGSTPASNYPALNHQYQTPTSGTPIYAVSSVIHNNVNPKVKNIPNSNGNWNNDPNVNQLPLQLQIPNTNQAIGMLNNGRSCNSQASSGYQSQSPVLEGGDKSNNIPINVNINNHISNQKSNRLSNEIKENMPALTFTNPVFARKSGSQSVDNLNSLGVDFLNDSSVCKRRMARSSSSSDCECPPPNMTPSKPKVRTPGAQKEIYSNLPNSHYSNPKSVIKPINNHRLSRRSSAELLRKNHPYSSSTDEEESDNLPNHERQDITPQLPPRRGQLKRNSGYRPAPIVDGNYNDQLQQDLRNSITENGIGINCSEYEREMVDLRLAMEALQSKLSRAEERLFGQEVNGQQQRRDRDRKSFSPNFNGALENERHSLGLDEQSKEMDHLLQRLLSAEEEMKREQDLLLALDKKQKLIDAQEEKIARLDSVNNQLLEALAQIRDTLQQQHMQQQQQKIQQQLLFHQQHLQNLSKSMIPNGVAKNKNASYDRMNYPTPAPRDHHQLHSGHRSSSINNINSNTTKVLITNGNNSNNSIPSPSSNSIDNRYDPNRNSTTYLGEQALKMLAELKSSSC